MNTHGVSEMAFERMFSAVEKVRDRLRRATTALEAAGIPYAVVGGNAVAAWVGEVDEAAVRFTQVVDILLKRDDLNLANAALEAAGFVYRHVKSIDMFLDGPNAKARDAVHILFAGEKVLQEDLAAAPNVEQSRRSGVYQVLELESLVRMKLTAYRRKDQVHIQDMIDVGLIDATWPARLPGELAARLQSLLDDPHG